MEKRISFDENENLFKGRKLSISQTENNQTEGPLVYSILLRMNTLIEMLRTSQGRNKLSCLIQYVAKFSAACIIYTVDTNEIKNNKLEMLYERHSNLKSIEKSMSNARKIFRFLKFVEDLKKFYSFLYDSSFDMITILKALTTLSACFYHFLDNLVWASNVGMINRVITGELNWKTSKNFFSLLRTSIKLVTSIIDFKNCFTNSKMDCEEERENFEEILNETFKNRSRLRIITLDILQLLLKILVLFYSMKVTVIYRLLHPITVSLFGIIACLISLFKIYHKADSTQKKILKNIGSRSFSRLNLPFKSSFELSLLDRVPNCKIFEKNYFENYYIDFNKDFPVIPDMVLKYRKETKKLYQ